MPKKRIKVRHRVLLHHDVYTDRWIQSMAQKNLWKLNHHYSDYDDLVQDGYLCWYIVANRYSHIRQRTHLMALFKSSFRNYINNLSKHGKYLDDQGYVSAELKLTDLASAADNDKSECWIIDSVLSDKSSEFPIELLIAQAHDPVREVLALLTSDEGIQMLRKPRRVYSDGSRETLNDRLCRSQGLDPADVNLLGMVKSYLTDFTESYV